MQQRPLFPYRKRSIALVFGVYNDQSPPYIGRREDMMVVAHHAVTNAPVTGNLYRDQRRASSGRSPVGAPTIAASFA